MYNGLTLPTAADDDFFDFLPPANSSGATNLAGLFGVALQPPPDETNTTLKYVSPKSNQVHQEKSNWNVVIAKVVTAFKLGANKQNECQGRLGFALLQQSDDAAVAKLILYRTKSQILSTALLVPNKSLTFKQEYLQYTDDSNIFWSLNFTSSDEANVFLQELDKKCPVTHASATELATEAIKIKTELSEAAADIDTNTEPHETVVDASKKSDIVLRMARVGQALPMPNILNNQSTTNESDLSIASNGSGDSDTSLVLSTLPSHSHTKPTNISLAVQTLPNYWHPPSGVASFASSNLNNFVSENRVQNAETRMNLSKLETKLDRVLDNIEMLKLSAGKSSARNGGPDLEDEIIKLEEKLVDLKKENRLLKLKLVEAESKGPPSTSAGNEELDTVKEQLETVKKNVEILHRDKSDQEAKIQQLEEKLREETEKTNAASTAKDELEAKVKELDGELKSELESKKSKANDVQDQAGLNARVEELEKQLKESEAKIAEHEQNGQAAQTKSHETIRSIMNKLYVELFQNVNGRDTMTSAEVLKLTAELIRRETKAALTA